jgi:hypothetical protein
MQHTSFGPTPFTNVRTPSSDAIDLRQGRSGGYDKPAYAGSKLSGTRHGGVVLIIIHYFEGKPLIRAFSF